MHMCTYYIHRGLLCLDLQTDVQQPLGYDWAPLRR
jgi:hypothetical protein